MAKVSRKFPRRARIAVQTACYVLFLAFVIRIPALVTRGARADWLMRLSPFSALGSMLSSWEFLAVFLPAAFFLAAAFFLGRYFCGWMCPLGTTIDIWDGIVAFVGGRERNSRAGFDTVPELRRLKYYVFAGCTAAALLGASVFGYFDPLSLALRSYVLVVHNFLANGASRLLAAFAGSPGAGPTAEAGGAALRELLLVRALPTFELSLLTALVLLAVLGVGLWQRRFWCRAVCPLGGMYAVAARWSLAKRTVAEDCTHCGRCVEVCPMECISADGRNTLGGECILCMNCQAVCPVDAVRFLGRAGREQEVEVNVTRRGLAAAFGAALVSWPLFKVSPAGKASRAGAFIRPPLAGEEEEEFLQKCLRCGQCMRACPNNAIQPAGIEGGLESLWTPKLVPRLGYCEYECDICGRACPSGAIPRFALARKHVTAIGLAFVNRSRCIPWRAAARSGAGASLSADNVRAGNDFDWDAHNCGVCEEVCPAPTKAIHFERIAGPEGQELRLPYVRSEVCVGCGFCEHACPVQGAAAIRVTGGFRKLAPPAEVRRKVAVETALPAAVGSLKLSGPTRTHEGAKELYQYIDGAGEPYLTLNFQRVASATYAAGDGRVLKVDMWRFASPDDAFGAFAMDRAGDPVAIGDEGAVLGASLWARKGSYMLSITPLRGAPDRTQVVGLAGGILSRIDTKPAPRPEICRRLPQQKLIRESVRFARDFLVLQDVALTERLMPDGTLGITGGAVAACGAYELRKDSRETWVLLVRHLSAGAAKAAAGRLEKVRAGWGDKRLRDSGPEVFEGAGEDFCAFEARGRDFAAVFFAPDAVTATKLLRKALGDLQ